MSELQRAVLDFVHAYHEAGSGAPSTPDILKAFRYRNESSVVHTLNALATAGQLTCVADRWALKQPEVQLHLSLPGDRAGLPT